MAVSGASNTAISNEDQQICVEGLKHGERYAIVLRQGLPSVVGEALLKAADYEIYVRDRSPQAHFAGRAYVLPREGQEGAPLVTVNTGRVAIDVYRIGDRNLVATVSRDDFLKPIDTSRAQEIADQDGQKVWSGSMEVASELNKDVTTEFPVMKAVGKLDPGVYLVTARPWKEKTSDSSEPEEGQLATQWMVVSDLGLTAISGDDGVHTLVQSLGSAGPVAGVELKLVARNNEVLAVKTTGADGRADFDPGFARGKGGSAPGLLVATLGGDYNFLNLADNAFDLTDRGVAGRDAPAGLDAFLYTERGVYRSGETVFATALLRDARGVARTGLPLTLVVKRPDGVEYKRATLPDEGLGGRAFAVPLLPGSAPGKWSLSAYADPKGDPIGSVEFLLEDYIPERLDFTLKPTKAFIATGEPVALTLDARFLYGAPASGLDVTGAVRLQAVAGGALAGFPGYVAGLADDDFTTVETQFSDKVTTDAEGHAELSVALPDAVSTRPLEAKLIVDVGEPGGRTVERTITLPVRMKGVAVGVKPDFDSSISAGDQRPSRRLRSRPMGRGSRARPPNGRSTRSTNDYQWFNSDGRWNYEPVKSSKRIASGVIDIGADAPAKISAPVQWGAHRLDIKTLDGEETSLRSTSAGRAPRRRHARQRRRHARQDRLRARRRGEAAHQLPLRRQGDRRARRRHGRALHRRRPRRGRQRRPVHGRRRLGAGRLCGRADPPSARRQGAAHAGPGDRARLVRDSTRRPQARRRHRRAGADEAARSPERADRGHGTSRRAKRRMSRSPPSTSASSISPATRPRIRARSSSASVSCRSRSATSGAC